MAGRYKAYSEYKDSGVSWLEKVPSHWDITKTAWHFVAEKGKNGQVLTNEYIGQNNGDYPVYSGQTGNNGVMGCIDTYEFDTGKEGVLFSTTVGAKAMTLNHLKGKFSLSQNCLIIQKTSPIFNTRFCFYHFQPLFSFERGLIPEHMQASFRMEDLYQYKIALPSFEEQQKIASFLDHETAKIDTLIAKQEKLIELLKEKRQAVISHAVTKGLNPNASMRDSGVEWLGEVPEHWGMKRLKYLGEAKNGLTYSPNDVVSEDEGVLVLRSSNIQDAKLSFTDNVYVDMDIPSRIRVKENDLLICSRNGSRKLIGKNALMTKEAVGMAFGAFMVIFRSEVNPYLYWVLNSPLFEYQSGSFLTSTINQLTIGNLEGMEVPLPPKNEQAEIKAYLINKTLNFDQLITKAIYKVKLLNERKTALISAAVTGKIDVRDWKPQGV